jgi:cytochrome c1
MAGAAHGAWLPRGGSRAPVEAARAHPRPPACAHAVCAAAVCALPRNTRAETRSRNTRAETTPGADDAEAPLVKFKVSLGGDMRRFSCAGTFEAVVEQARQRFGLAACEAVQLQYQDADNDRITVGSTDELQEAIAEAPPDAVLRLAVVFPKPLNKVEGLRAAEPGAGAAEPGHLEQLMLAAIDALDLDREATLAWVAGLKPDEVKAALKQSPLAFAGAFLASSKKAEHAFAAASAAAANASRASSSAEARAELASTAAALASTAAAAVASSGRGCRGHREIAAMVAAMAAAAPHGSTADRQPELVPHSAEEPSLLPQRVGLEAACASWQPKQVSITDTDGDTMVFKLSADESRVEEWVNGALEIEDVKQMQMDVETGVVRDAKGRFTVRPEEREEKLQALNALLGRVGVVIKPLQVAPAQTVYIDVDLNASEQQQQQAGVEAGARVREACGSMGADPEAALKKLAAVFAALPIGQTEQGQRASAALSSGLKAAKEGLSVAKQVVDSMHKDEPGIDHKDEPELPPRAPDPFEYAPTESAEAGDAAVERLAEEATEPERPEAEAAPQGQWSQQLQQIREMGLGDVVSEWELVEIVEKYLGSLDRVVEVLIQRQLQKTDAMV